LHILFEEMLLWALDGWADRRPEFAIEITEEQAAEAVRSRAL
jgi:hypothetical protein